MLCRSVALFRHGLGHRGSRNPASLQAETLRACPLEFPNDCSSAEVQQPRVCGGQPRDLGIWQARSRQEHHWLGTGLTWEGKNIQKHVYISSSSAKLILNSTWPKSQELNCRSSHVKLHPNLSPAQRKCPCELSRGPTRQIGLPVAFYSL